MLAGGTAGVVATGIEELGDHDVVGEVDTGSLEHALSTQVVEDVRGTTTYRTFSVASFLLPPLLAHLLLSERRSMRWPGRAPNSRESERDGRKWPSVKNFFDGEVPESSHCTSRSRSCRPGPRLRDLGGRAARPKEAQSSVRSRNRSRCSDALLEDLQLVR